MADNVVRFDKYYRIKKELPGFGAPGFASAYVEARAFLHVAEGNFLSCSELTHVAAKLVSPLAASMVKQILRQRGHIARNPEIEQ